MSHLKENATRDIQGHKMNEPDKIMQPKATKTNRFPDQNNFSKRTCFVTVSVYINPKETKNGIPNEVRKLALRHTKATPTIRPPHHE
ncbi:MAG: hypothetical protein NPIRA03_02110 [Nitrospirales bacterium]|nr:MAG: hypothetical protein NPIRA03_02110 [Nitrospirales bacterium]